MLAVNNEKLIPRSEIIWEKGTNRSAFFRGEIDKYGWVDMGSSFLPSELQAAYLYAQLEEMETIQNRRKAIWNAYFEGLTSLENAGKVKLPSIPSYATNNAHMFYLVCNNLEERTALIAHLKKDDILAVFHYLSLHDSPFYKDKHDGRDLPNSDRSRPVNPGDSITQAQADAFFAEDLRDSENDVKNLVKVKLTSNQFSALVSFAYNTGADQFESSTLLRLLNSGDYAGAAGQFGRWINGANGRLEGLVVRRAKERALFLS
jgi:GH24 family phage-related lysozyme (muramidase)